MCSISLGRKRNEILDIYKGILIILVVLRHALQYSVVDEGGILGNFIWAIQMPGFMLAAGYFSARKIDNLKEAGKSILLAAQRYALPFFAWFMIIDVLLLGNEERSLIKGLCVLLTHIDVGMWFLWVVFVLSIVAVFCNLTSGKGREHNKNIVWTILVVCGFLCVFIAIAYAAGINFLGVKYIMYYGVFYGFGWLMRKPQEWWKRGYSKIADFVVFISLVIFLAIVYNYDLYRCEDNLVSIVLRCIAGFTGNVVLLWFSRQYKDLLKRIKLDRLGMYTLEIYTTHMYVNHLLVVEEANSFFTPAGFGDFMVSLILTVGFTGLIILVFKSIRATNFIFYGKNK